MEVRHEQLSCPPSILGSWKEIAAFFGKGTRTVQRWEHDFGLPVCRPAGKPLGMVSASPVDLEQWWSSQWQLKRAAKSRPSRPTSATGPGLHENIRQARALRHLNHQLSDELHERMQALRQCCASMALKVKDSA